MNKSLVVLILLTASSPALCATDWLPTGTKIDALYFCQDIVLIDFSPFLINTQGCSKTDRDMAIIRNTDDSHNEMISALLAAAAAGNNVTLAFNGCGGGDYDYPSLYRVGVSY